MPTSHAIAGEVFGLQRVPIDRILGLRHAVLRPGLPPDAARWEGDHDPATRHYAALDPAGDAAACATLLLNAWQDEPAWQLRGMAVRPDLARKGLGSAVLRLIERDIIEDPSDPAAPVTLLWANARAHAAPFYTSRGWAIASDIFDIPTVGPHYRITRELA